MTSRGLLRISFVVISASIAAPLAATAADAATHPAPLCGALNMIEAAPSFYGTNAVSDGMDIAMSRDNTHGNDGMFGAVAKSSQASSPGCTTP